METLKQTLTVPKNHRLHFDVTLPENFPTGTTEVLLVFSPQTSRKILGASHPTKKMRGFLQGIDTSVLREKDRI